MTNHLLMTHTVQDSQHLIISISFNSPWALSDQPLGPTVGQGSRPESLSDGEVQMPTSFLNFPGLQLSSHMHGNT